MFYLRNSNSTELGTPFVLSVSLIAAYSGFFGSYNALFNMSAELGAQRRP